jgi:hypothetical protein
MFSRLKSLPLTIVLTILIWMYAEAQFTSTKDNVRLLIKITPPSADLTIRVLDPQGNPRSLASVVVTLQGPKDQLDRIYQQGQFAGSPDDDISSLTYVPPISSLLLGPQGGGAEGGDVTIETLAMVNNLDYFRRQNIIATAATPPRIRLDVDTLERLAKTIDFRPTVPVSHFSFSPEQVTVTVPSRVLQAMGGIDKLNVIAEPVPGRDLSSLPTDSEQTVPVRYRLEYPGAKDDRITVTPVQGTVALRLPKREGITQTIPDVPIWLAAPPGLLQKSEADLRTRSVRVTVTGSAPAIEQLRQRLSHGTPGTAGIRVYLDLIPEDRPSPNYTVRRLRYVLPEGLTSPDQPPEIDFRLLQRPAATAPATGP